MSPSVTVVQSSTYSPDAGEISKLTCYLQPLYVQCMLIFSLSATDNIAALLVGMFFAGVVTTLIIGGLIATMVAVIIVWLKSKSTKHSTAEMDYIISCSF